MALPFDDMTQYLPVSSKTRFFIDNQAQLWDRELERLPVMSQSRYEASNTAIALTAKGDVLIGGLGIGLIVLPIMRNLLVTSVTVVEKHQEVIDLVAPRLPLNQKVTIVHDDFFTFVPRQRFDTIWIDLWISELDLGRGIPVGEDFQSLIERYRPFLKPLGIVSRWRLSPEAERIEAEYLLGLRDSPDE